MRRGGQNGLRQIDPDISAPPFATFAVLEMERIPLAASHRVAPSGGCDAVARTVLEQWQQRFLDRGAFSRVYVLVDRHVMKFCRDLASLHIMARLSTQSRLFPRVALVVAKQALSGRQGYHMPAVERLQEGYPVSTAIEN